LPLCTYERQCGRSGFYVWTKILIACYQPGLASASGRSQQAEFSAQAKCCGTAFGKEDSFETFAAQAVYFRLGPHLNIPPNSGARVSVPDKIGQNTAPLA